MALFPCNECAKAIIQSGVKEVCYLSDKYADSPATLASKRMMDSAGVKYTCLLYTSLDDLTLAAAGGADGGGLHGHSHEVLGSADLAGAAALLTGLHHAVGGTGAVARGAVLDPLDGDFLFTAEGCFFKGQVQPGAYVFAPAGCLLGEMCIRDSSRPGRCHISWK